MNTKVIPIAVLAALATIVGTTVHFVPASVKEKPEADPFAAIPQQKPVDTTTAETQIALPPVDVLTPQQAEAAKYYSAKLAEAEATLKPGEKVTFTDNTDKVATRSFDSYSDCFDAILEVKQKIDAKLTPPDRTVRCGSLIQFKL